MAEKRSVRELLEAFPSITPPFDHFLEWCPKLTPRFYTISSSAKVDKARVAITVSLSQTELPHGRKHIGITPCPYPCPCPCPCACLYRIARCFAQPIVSYHLPHLVLRCVAGVCSNYLIGLRPGQDSIWAFVRTSTFRLPRIMGAPLILVCTQRATYQSAVCELFVTY